MTTIASLPHATTPESQEWPPYQDLEKEPKDMQQSTPGADLIEKLRVALTPGYHYPYHPTTIIGTEIPIYYGAPNSQTRQPSNIRPDILIARNVDSLAIHRRVGYDPIQNGKPPDVVMEVASFSTYRNDAGPKRATYALLGVPEYWRFDPTGGEMLGQPLIGEVRVGRTYRPLPLQTYPDGSVGSVSPLLNLNFRYRNGIFTIHDPATGAEYQHPAQENVQLRDRQNLSDQEIARLRQGQTQSDQEIARLRQERAESEQENARLREELRRLRGE